MFFKQKKIDFLGAVASVIVVIPLFILGEDAIPVARLLTSGAVFLLFPNRNGYIVK